MKHLSTNVALFLFCSLLFVSCGKTSEQKQMETDLNKRVMQLHDEGMMKMRQLKGLAAQLDSAQVLFDSLAAKFPKDAASAAATEIAQSKERIAAAGNAMEAWMSGHKPYDETMKHDVVATKLNEEIQNLASVNTRLDAAIANATSTIENQKKMAAELLAKKPAKKGGK
jgi:hypothetical protein